MEHKFSSEKKKHPSYEGVRRDVIRHMKNPKVVLDVGCSTGAIARVLGAEFNAAVWGIDVNPESLKEAAPFLQESVVADLDDSNFGKILFDRKFDHILLADVLEHTKNPYDLMSLFYSRLQKDGVILISIPNVAHWQTFVNLFLLRWPLRDRGIFDSTHLRFFALKNLDSLAMSKGKVEVIARNYRIRESGDGRIGRVFAKMIGCIPWLREFVTFQYILRATLK